MTWTSHQVLNISFQAMNNVFRNGTTIHFTDKTSTNTGLIGKLYKHWDKPNKSLNTTRTTSCSQAAASKWICRLTSIGIPMFKIHIPGKTVFILRRGPGNFHGVNTLNKYYSFDAMTVYGNKLHTSLIDRSEDRNVQKGEWIYKR